MRVIDLTGKVFSSWTVLKRDGSNKRGQVTWFCQCKCGKIKSIVSTSLLSGNSKSCGCERISPNKKHGLSQTKEYLVWRSMIARCNNKNVKAYPDYGGRGIKVCPRWKESFKNFIVDMGMPPKKYTIERKNNNGNYEPSNCVWAPFKTQANNTRANRTLTIDGVRKTMSQWADISGIKIGTLHKRLKMGWDDKKAVFYPIKIIEP